MNRIAGVATCPPNLMRGNMKIKHTYTGQRVPPLIPVCIYEGYEDALREVNDNLYRFPIWKRIGWIIGQAVGYLL
jgi:hypothetical protein